MHKVILFPDTNVFIQCKALEELDWSAWESFEEVSLLVTRPVQAEIDRQKGTGNGRLASRARKASSLFRKILTSDQKYLEIRGSKPIVRVYLRQDLKRDESLSNELIYEERDDQLVGTVALYSKHNTSQEVLLLTHDTGPMTTAQMVGVSYWPIPDSWLMPPEADESERRLKAAQTELALLRKAEPQISSRVASGEMDTLKSLAIEVYVQLSEDEISKLLAQIKLLVPIETDFGPRTPAVDDGMLSALFERKFVPSDEASIEAYKNEHYPAWLSNCADFLRTLHEKINLNTQWPNATVWLHNVGTRPAEHALISLSANGSIQIMPPIYKPEHEVEMPPEELSLPLPPSAPKGTWTTTPKFRDSLGFFGSRDTKMFLSPMEQFNTTPIAARFPRSSQEPNKFYYEERPTLPVSAFQLTCTQWRHQSDEEPFNMTLHVTAIPGIYNGSIEVKVLASNMSTPMQTCYPVKITVTGKSTLETAIRIVNDSFKQVQKA